MPHHPAGEAVLPALHEELDAFELQIDVLVFLAGQICGRCKFERVGGFLSLAMRNTNGFGLGRAPGV